VLYLGEEFLYVPHVVYATRYVYVPHVDCTTRYVYVPHVDYATRRYEDKLHEILILPICLKYTFSIFDITSVAHPEQKGFKLEPNLRITPMFAEDICRVDITRDEVKPYHA
jgi:hypothetical protein